MNTDQPSETAGTPAPAQGGTPARPVSAGPTAGASPAAEAAPARGKSGKKGGIGWLILVVILAMVAGGGYYAYDRGLLQPYIAGLQHDDDEAPEVMGPTIEDVATRQEQLSQTLEALASRIDSLEQGVSAVKKAVDRLAARDQITSPEMIQDIGERVARLESQAAMAVNVGQQLRALEASTTAARETASKLATTVLAVGQLADTMASGTPFVRELAAVRAFGGDDTTIATAAASLEPIAAHGVPTMAALRNRFAAVADDAARAAPVVEGDGWSEQVVSRLASLVTVRRIGDNAVASGGVDGILAQAQTALSDGDLLTAVNALDQLEGAPAAAFEDWLQAANTRLQANEALSVIQQRAIARLTSAKG
ncbi:MAG: hypothetical protein IPK66_13685 [Rhodospirillales bacterium]|nr:hypothetical protein [Rhodospirillales bacterium]